MKRSPQLLIGLLLFYLAIIFPLTSYMKNRPIIEKLGYIPQAEVMKLFSTDQKQFIASLMIMKVISYYGSLVEKAQHQIYITPEYYGIYKMIEVAAKLDPYNMDGYYFAQATLTWNVNRIQEVNDLLAYGMNYRDWDFYLPFFAGFNYSYFLKDYARAAEYYKKAADLTGSELSINLAGRYMYESGQTDLAIIYLSAMEKSATNEAIKKTFQARLKAFQAVRRIELAVERYRKNTHRSPGSVEGLLHAGYLKEMPVDPYGGTFYIDKEGKVRSTSKFAFGFIQK